MEDSNEAFNNGTLFTLFLEYRFNKDLQKTVKIHSVFKVPVIHKGKYSIYIFVEVKYDFFGKRKEFTKCNQ